MELKNIRRRLINIHAWGDPIANRFNNHLPEGH